MDPNSVRRIRMAVWFSLQGDLRYLSHHDTMTLWRRVLVRARIPVRYSQGFNPHIRMSLPLPRPVGVAGEHELLLVDLTEEIDPAKTCSALQRQAPAGVHIQDIQPTDPKASALPLWAGYDIELKEGLDTDTIQRSIDGFNKNETWLVSRPEHGRHPKRDIDLRRGVHDLCLTGTSLTCRIDIQPQGTPRLDEILAALNLSLTENVRLLRRTRVAYAAQGHGRAGKL